MAHCLSDVMVFQSTRAAVAKCHQLVAYKEKHIVHSTGGWRLRLRRYLAHFGRDCSLARRQPRWLCSHVVEGRGSLGPDPARAELLRTALSPKTAPWGLGFQHLNLGDQPGLCPHAGPFWP